jgi:Siphovirus ReqiPepy6 Gp37-like protein
MDFYTLTGTFLPDELIDQFVSAIWTERYKAAGDFQLVVPATRDNIAKLKEGKYLALRGTTEIMQIQTQSIEKQLMTVTGFSLTAAILNQRYVWKNDPSGDGVADWTVTSAKAGEFIANVVETMVINTVPFGGGSLDVGNLDWAMEELPFLTLGPVDTSGIAKRQTAAIGPLYDSIASIANAENVGILLYLEEADPVMGYSLKFTTYQGVDRTSDQDVVPLIRLLPDLDSITDIKEINSIGLYKNVAYVYYQNKISKHLAEPTLPEPEGLDRRVLITDAVGAPVGHKEERYSSWGGWRPGGTYSQIVVGPADIAAFREQNARDAFANANYIHAVDGQTSPNSEYVYGTHFGLGDLIELQGLTGAISKARITEYIRSQDQYGEKNYPTISVIGQT